MNLVWRSPLYAIALLASAYAAGSDVLRAQTIATGEFEASEILPTGNLLTGSDEAYWLIGDEKKIESNNIRLLTRPKGEWNWEIHTLGVSLETPGIKTDDSEALARLGSNVYIIGSHFGKKQGPLQLERQFIARFDDSRITAIGSTHVSVEIGAINFKLHRLINDALSQLPEPVVQVRPLTAKLIADSMKKLSGEPIKKTDLPVNIEGAAFLPSGDLLIGLRFPVTASGHPILLGVSGIGSLFGDAGSPELAIMGSWVLESVGDIRQFVGVRAMGIHSDSLDLVVGSIERSADSPLPILAQDYPEGIYEAAAHVRLPLAALDSGPMLRAQVVRLLAGSAIESVASTDHGERYVADKAEDVNVLYTVK